jgi:hypothetical protein
VSISPTLGCCTATEVRDESLAARSLGGSAGVNQERSHGTVVSLTPALPPYNQPRFHRVVERPAGWRTAYGVSGCPVVGITTTRASVCGRRADQVKRRQSGADSEAHPKRNAAAAPQTEADFTRPLPLLSLVTSAHAAQWNGRGRRAKGTTRSPWSEAARALVTATAAILTAFIVEIRFRVAQTPADTPLRIESRHELEAVGVSVNTERKDFLSVMHTTPAWLDVQETAWYLGFAEHDIPVLVRAGLLKPLGHPPANGVKYFGAATLAILRDDVQWLGRASDAIVRHWKSKNRRKSRNGDRVSLRDQLAPTRFAQELPMRSQQQPIPARSPNSSVKRRSVEQ